MSSGLVVDDAQLYATHVGSTVVSCWLGVTNVPAIKRYRSMLESVYQRHGKLVQLIIINPAVRGGYDKETRNEASALTRDMDPRLVCLAFVVCGSGAVSTLARAVLTGIQLLARPKTPWSVFGDDIAAAVAWMGEHAAKAGQAYDPIAVTDAASDALAAIVVRRSAGGSGGRATPSHPPSKGASWRPDLPRPMGRYTLTRRLAAGGMGEVFLATSEASGGFEKQLVVKCIHRHLTEKGGFREMFAREARIAARLSNTHVVQIFDAGEEDGVPFIAMEYVDGISAREALDRFAGAGRDVPVPVAATIASDAARGLHYAHGFRTPEGELAPVIHRDISLDNLVIARDGTTKVLDFGVAKTSDATHATTAGTLKGKVPYMPPEQLRGEELDGRADLYSLGCALHLLLTDEPPFRGNDASVVRRILEEVPRGVRELRADVPDGVERVVSDLLEKDMSKRPRTGLEVAQRLALAVPPDRDAVAAFVTEALALARRDQDGLEDTRTAKSTQRSPGARRNGRTATLLAVAAVLAAVLMAALIILR